MLAECLKPDRAVCAGDLVGFFVAGSESFFNTLTKVEIRDESGKIIFRAYPSVIKLAAGGFTDVFKIGDTFCQSNFNLFSVHRFEKIKSDTVSVFLRGIFRVGVGGGDRF